MKILLLDSSFVKGSVQGFLLDFFKPADVVFSIDDCVNNKKADLIVISESILSTDNNVSSTTQQLIDIHSIKARAGTPSCHMIGLSTHPGDIRQMKPHVNELIFVNDIFKKNSAVLDSLEKFKESRNILIIDREEFSRDRIMMTLKSFIPSKVSFEGFDSFSSFNLVSASGNKFNLALISADLCLKIGLKIKEFKKMFGTPLCKVIVMSSHFDELPDELTDADLFIKKDDLWNLRISKENIKLVEKILALYPTVAY